MVGFHGLQGSNGPGGIGRTWKQYKFTPHGLRGLTLPQVRRFQVTNFIKAIQIRPLQHRRRNIVVIVVSYNRSM